MITQQDIQNAYKELSQARAKLFWAAENEAGARNAYSDAKDDYLRSGAITGKNAEEREARANEMLTREQSELRQAQRSRHEAENRLDLARFAIFEINALLKLMVLGEPQEAMPEPALPIVDRHEDANGKFVYTRASRLPVIDDSLELPF